LYVCAAAAAAASVNPFLDESMAGQAQFYGATGRHLYRIFFLFIRQIKVDDDTEWKTRVLCQIHMQLL